MKKINIDNILLKWKQDEIMFQKRLNINIYDNIKSFIIPYENNLMLYLKILAIASFILLFIFTYLYVPPHKNLKINSTLFNSKISYNLNVEYVYDAQTKILINGKIKNIKPGDTYKLPLEINCPDKASFNIKNLASIKILKKSNIAIINNAMFIDYGNILLDFEKRRKPFYIIHRACRIKILGTKLKIIATKDNININLLDGQILITNIYNQVLLNPGESASISIKSTDIKTDSTKNSIFTKDEN